MVNSLSAGCFTGAVLSAKGKRFWHGFVFLLTGILGGPKAALMGCAGFAAFSAAVEHFLQDKS